MGSNQRLDDNFISSFWSTNSVENWVPYPFYYGATLSNKDLASAIYCKSVRKLDILPLPSTH
jgi:hypothetical protein